MTNNPKITNQTINEVLKLSKTDVAAAKRFLSNLLNLKKTQTNEWYNRIIDFGKKPKSVVTIKRKIKRLFWDIEVSPNIVLSWRLGNKVSLDHNALVKERAIICISYKWEDEKEVNVLHWDENQCDKKMLIEFLKIANQADELVGHNGDNFDMAWFKTRCLFHGLNITPKYKTVDTLKLARKIFYFNSNRLDYIAQYLGIGAKIKTGFSLWKEVCLDKNQNSLNLMVNYCKKDVLLLESVYHKLCRFIAPETHTGVLAGKDRWSCPHDGSENVTLSKVRVSSAGIKSFQMRCIDCGAYFTISESVYNDFLEMKNGLISA